MFPIKLLPSFHCVSVIADSHKIVCFSDDFVCHSPYRCCSQKERLFFQLLLILILFKHCFTHRLISFSFICLKQCTDLIEWTKNKMMKFLCIRRWCWSRCRCFAAELRHIERVSRESLIMSSSHSMFIVNDGHNNQNISQHMAVILQVWFRYFILVESIKYKASRTKKNPLDRKQIHQMKRCHR